jgi:CRP-like cAMP-binding protein
MHPRSYEAGEHLIRQDEPGEYLLLIFSGAAEAFVHHGSGDRTKVGEFGRTDVVGEISPLTGEPRTADVVARTPVRALQLSTADFQRLAAAKLEVRLLLTNVVADRLGGPNRRRLRDR